MYLFTKNVHHGYSGGYGLGLGQPGSVGGYGLGLGPNGSVGGYGLGPGQYMHLFPSSIFIKLIFQNFYVYIFFFLALFKIISTFTILIGLIMFKFYILLNINNNI